MFYSAIHARKRGTGEFVIPASGFSPTVGNPPPGVHQAWRELRDDPRIGEHYTDVQYFEDNSVRETLRDLPHPDIAEAAQQALLQAEIERAVAEREAEAAKLRARLAELEEAGLTFGDAAKAKAEAAAEAEAAAKAAAPASPATITPPEEGYAQGAGESGAPETPAPAPASPVSGKSPKKS